MHLSQACDLTQLLLILEAVLSLSCKLFLCSYPKQIMFMVLIIIYFLLIEISGSPVGFLKRYVCEHDKRKATFQLQDTYKYEYEYVHHLSHQLCSTTHIHINWHVKLFCPYALVCQISWCYSASDRAPSISRYCCICVKILYFIISIHNYVHCGIARSTAGPW